MKPDAMARDSEDVQINMCTLELPRCVWCYLTIGNESIFVSSQLSGIMYQTRKKCFDTEYERDFMCHD